MASLDTHSIITELIASGTSEKQAEVFVSRFAVKEELHSVEKDQAQLATKMDIVKLESKIDNININMKWQSAAILLVLGLLLKDVIFN